MLFRRSGEEGVVCAGCRVVDVPPAQKGSGSSVENFAAMLEVAREVKIRQWDFSGGDDAPIDLDGEGSVASLSPMGAKEWLPPTGRCWDSFGAPP